MYGVRADLDLSTLNGVELEQVGIGSYAVVLSFSLNRTIGIEGRYEILSPIGESVESGRPDELRSQHLVDLLGASIVTATPSPPQTVELRFSTGHVLRLIDDSEKYESFSIQPGDIFV